MPVRAVVFDLGKVLLDFDYRIAIQQLVPRTRLSIDELNRLINQSTLLHDYETGSLKTPEFFRQVQAASGFDGDLTEFAAMFANIFTPIEPMVALHAELRLRRIPTFILSNTNDLAIQHIRARFPFFQRFDGYVLSYEHGSMKPAPPLYEITERLAGARGSELFYVDDRPENVVTALERGWLGVVHETPERSRAAMQDAGLLG